MTGIEKPFRKTAVAAALALTVAGGNGNAGPPDSPAVDEPASQAMAPAAEVAPRAMSLQQQIAFSRMDLAGRLDVAPDEVTLSGATPVTWRSGALGCPEPGMQYTQAEAPGIWIMLRAAGSVHRYHAARNGKPFHCPGERAEPPVTGGGAD
jgi:hypothetical protein